MKQYEYQPASLGRLQSIETVHRTATNTRFGEHRVPDTTWRTFKRRPLSITPGDNGNRTPSPIPTICGSRSGICSSHSLDHGHARYRNCMMTMTTWSVMASHKIIFRSLLAVPTSSASTVVFDWYTNTGLDGTARARPVLWSFHEGCIATYKRPFTFGVTKEN